MRHLDLFSGIGGFALGLESTGHFETVAFCEIEEYPRRVLRRHWPDVHIFEDIHRLGGVSLAGFVGRWNTPRFRRAAESVDLSPDWLVIENEGHRWRRWVPELRRALHERGYASLPIRVRADFLGFPHRRARVFLVANPDSLKLRELKRWWTGPGREVEAELANPRNNTPERLGAHDGVPDRLDRCKALGNAVVPQIVAAIGRAIVEVEKG